MRRRYEDSEKIEEQLWQNFQQDPSKENKDALITHYLWYVKYICSRVAMELPARIRSEDLISSGVMGLIDAIEKFDKRKDSQFRTYAFSRIRGGILDELRRLDWAPRALRKKARQLNKVSSELEQRLHRKPTTEEIALEADVDPQEVSQVYREVNATALLSLEDTLWFDDGQTGRRRIDMIEDQKVISPKKALEIKEAKNLLVSAIQELSNKERLVVVLYYYEEMTLKEIGKVLDISESRVCQLHSQAMENIRKWIERKEKFESSNNL